MFGTSICQLITTVPKSFTTLAMPAPGDYWTDIVNIQGTRLGNIHTCTAQGFLTRFGDISGCAYFSGLSVYYACAIGFGMTIETMQIYIEPVVHIVPILLGLYSALPALFVGGYNVSNDWPSCTVAAKPWFCNNDNSTVACARGGVGTEGQLQTNQYLVRHMDPPLVGVMILCFFIVCCRVYQRDRKMATFLKDWSEGDSDGDGDNDGYSPSSVVVQNLPYSVKLRRGVYRFSNGEEISTEEIRQRVKDHYKDTKVIVSQAILYFAVYFVIFACDHYYLINKDNLYQHEVFDILLCLGQGFYQLLIFIFHLVFNQRRNDPNVSIFEAIREIFKGGSGNETFILTRMHAVQIAPRDFFEDSYFYRRGRLENSDESSWPLLSSCGVSAVFGSALSLPTNGRSLISALWLEDDNSSTCNIHKSTSENEIENGNGNGNGNHTASSIFTSNRNNSAGLSRFSEQDKSIKGVSGNATFNHAEARINGEYELGYDGVQAELESESGPLLSSCGVSANFGSTSANFGSVTSSASPSPISTSWMMMDNNNNIQSTSENRNVRVVQRQNMEVIDDDSSTSSSDNSSMWSSSISSH